MIRDLRRYAQQTNVRLLVGFIFLMVFVGDGIIYLIYGQYAAISGLACIIAGLSPLVLIFLSLNILEAIAKKAHDK